MCRGWGKIWAGDGAYNINVTYGGFGGENKKLEMMHVAWNSDSMTGNL